MALILDETFATAIPAGFATARNSGGTFTQTYNAGAQGVDLSQTANAYGMWDLTSVGLSGAGEVEADIELVSIFNGAHALGLWLVDGSSPSVTNGVLAGYSSNAGGGVYAREWTGSTAWAGSSPSFINSAVKALDTVSVRQTLNMRWDMAASTKKTRVELRVDGVLVLVAPPPTDFVALRPSVWVYSGAARLHSIKVWDAPQSGLTEYSCKILPRAVALGAFSTPQERLPTGPITQIRRGVLGFRNIYQGGSGRIVGTVKESTPPANTPLGRKVQLVDESTRLLVRETWSDALTGAYDFQSIDAFAKYTVITYDYAQNYRAVIADNLTLANGGVELMP